MITFLLSVFLILFLTGRAPLRNLISLIGIFGFASLLLIYYDVEFLGWMLIMIYIGAIGVLFLFLIMTTDFRNIESTPSVSSYDYLLYVLICLLLFLHLPNFTSEGSFLQDELLATVPSDKFWGLQKWYHLETNTLFFVGLLMFNKYYVFVHLAAWILLIALVAAVGLSSDRWNDIKNLGVPAFLMKRLDKYPSDLIDFTRKNNLDPTVLDDFRTLRYTLPFRFGEKGKYHLWNIDSPYTLNAMRRYFKSHPNLGKKYGYTKPQWPYSTRTIDILHGSYNRWPYPIGLEKKKIPFEGEHFYQVGQTTLQGETVVKVEQNWGCDLYFELVKNYLLFQDEIDDYMYFESHWWAYLERYYNDVELTPFRTANLKYMLKHGYTLTEKGQDTAIGGEVLKKFILRPKKIEGWEEWETAELFTWMTWTYTLAFICLVVGGLYTMLTDYLFRTDSPYPVYREDGIGYEMKDTFSARGRFLDWELIPKRFRTELGYDFFQGTPLVLFMLGTAYYLTFDKGWLLMGGLAWTWCYPVGRPRYYPYDKGDEWNVILEIYLTKVWNDYEMEKNFFVRWYRSNDPEAFYLNAFDWQCAHVMEYCEVYLKSYDNWILNYAFDLLSCISIAIVLIVTIILCVPLLGASVWMIATCYLFIQPFIRAWTPVWHFLWDIAELAEDYAWKNRDRPDYAKFEERLINQALFEWDRALTFVARPFYTDPYSQPFYAGIDYSYYLFKETVKEEHKYYKPNEYRWAKWRNLNFYAFDPKKYPQFNEDIIPVWGRNHVEPQLWQVGFDEIRESYLEACKENDDKFYKQFNDRYFK